MLDRLVDFSCLNLINGALRNSKMSRSTWLSAATAASLVLLQHQTVANPPGSGWQLVFFDDFDGPAINETVWTVRDNFTHGGSEWELYMKDEVYTAMDGNTTALVMRTRVNPTPYGSRMYNWTSGWVDSAAKNQFTYGHFEFRAKLPDPSAQSVWPVSILYQSVLMTTTRAYVPSSLLAAVITALKCGPPIPCRPCGLSLTALETAALSAGPWAARLISWKALDYSRATKYSGRITGARRAEMWVHGTKFGS